MQPAFNGWARGLPRGVPASPPHPAVLSLRPQRPPCARVRSTTSIHGRVNRPEEGKHPTLGHAGLWCGSPTSWPWRSYLLGGMDTLATEQNGALCWSGRTTPYIPQNLSCAFTDPDATQKEISISESRGGAWQDVNPGCPAQRPGAPRDAGIGGPGCPPRARGPMVQQGRHTAVICDGACLCVLRAA